MSILSNVTPRRCVPTLGIVISLIAGGCGGMPAHVSGTVSVDGEPLERGSVVFYPVSGGPIASANIGPDGEYVLRTASQDGLPIGTYIVTVNSFSAPPTATMSPEEAKALSSVPSSYTSKSTSTLSVDVAKGHNDLPLRLTSDSD